MALQKTDHILRHRLNQHGLGGLVTAGSICRQAELLFPGQFHAVSLRANVLHIELAEESILLFKQIEGKLLTELNMFAASRHLPEITRIRLTFSK